MKKLVLSIIFLPILLLVFSITVSLAYAQPKNVTTCEEWKGIYGTKECPDVVRWQNGKEIWCYDFKEAESSPEGFGEYVGDKIYENPPNYKVDFDYDACMESWAKEKGFSSPVSESNETQQPSLLQQEKQSSGQGNTNFIDIFGINPYQAWLRLKETVEVTEFITSGGLEQTTESFFSRMLGKKTSTEKDAEAIQAKEDSYKKIFGENWREAIYREPKLSLEDDQKAWEVNIPQENKVTDVAGASNTKRYSWGTDSGTLVNTSSWENVEFKEPVVDEQEITRTVQFKEKGEVEIMVKNPDPVQNKFKVETDFFDLFVIQTHFWINQDPDKRATIVGVYKGEIEIITKDGRTAKVKPDGDKPGVIVVTQKLSMVKLVAIGVFSAAVIGGIYIVLRKIFFRKLFKKKK